MFLSVTTRIVVSELNRININDNDEDEDEDEDEDDDEDDDEDQRSSRFVVLLFYKHK
jgi:hypothetical protein